MLLAAHRGARATARSRGDQGTCPRVALIAALDLDATPRAWTSSARQRGGNGGAQRVRRFSPGAGAGRRSGLRSKLLQRCSLAEINNNDDGEVARGTHSCAPS